MHVGTFSNVHGAVIVPFSSISTPVNQRSSQAELRESLFNVAQKHPPYLPNDATSVTPEAYVCGLVINMQLSGDGWMREVALGIQATGDGTCFIAAQPTAASQKNGSCDQPAILHENYSSICGNFNITAHKGQAQERSVRSDGVGAAARARGSADAYVSRSDGYEGDAPNRSARRSTRIMVTDQAAAELSFTAAAKDDVYGAYAVAGRAAVADKKLEDP